MNLKTLLTYSFGKKRINNEEEMGRLERKYIINVNRLSTIYICDNNINNFMLN